MTFGEQAVQQYRASVNLCSLMTFGLAGAVLQTTGVNAVVEQVLTTGCESYSTVVQKSSDLAYATIFPVDAQKRLVPVSV